VGEKNPRYLLVGESGKIDYARYFRLLDELDYHGPIIVEVSSQIHSKPGYDGVKEAEKAFGFLSKVVSG
jgi:sugar phosphate isomerase/epimerase